MNARDEVNRIAHEVIGRVLARSIAGPKSCVLWIGDRNRSGYGLISVSHKKRSVHRIAYAALTGPIPEGLEIDHLCGVRNCVNPHHLEAVTHAENLRRSNRNWVVEGGKCTHGHLYTPENLYRRTGGGLGCKTCKRNASNSHKRRKRAAKGGDVG